MTKRKPKPFSSHWEAANALFDTMQLSEEEGRFCGGLLVRFYWPTPRQEKRLRKMLATYGLPALADEGHRVPPVDPGG